MNIDRETPMLLPVDMWDWLPEDHLVHFVLDAAGMMEMSAFKVNKRGIGNAYRCSAAVYMRRGSAP